MKKISLLIALFLSVEGAVWASSSPKMTDAEVKAILLPDVRIKSVTHFDADTSNGGTKAAHLDVEGVIAGSINFELLLPDEWNGRFAMGGGGGLVGSVQNSARDSINDGFATVGTDTGHQAGGTDGSWALDNMEALVNFGHVAIHRTAEVAKAIIRTYYGDPAKRSYFLGCSRGGGQALMEAQRYPDDFDGIVCGAPAFDWPGIAAMGTHMAQTFYPDPSNVKETVVTLKDLNHLYDAILGQVDAQDGVMDGIINDPPSVKFDLAAVEGLSKKQRKAIQTVYDDLMNGDELIYPGFPLGAEKGREGWYTWLTGPVPGMVNLSYAFSTNIMKYFVFNDPAWDYSTYDFADWEEDTHEAGAVLSAVDPNLESFASSGGKLIIWHGWSDPALTAHATTDYYDKVLEHDSKARDYARLFLIPGCYHCGGGPGVSSVNWLDEIVSWVEEGDAPEKIIASKPKQGDAPAMTRPLYPYPLKAEYKGSGDPNDAANFEAR